MSYVYLTQTKMFCLCLKLTIIGYNTNVLDTSIANKIFLRIHSLEVEGGISHMSSGEKWQWATLHPVPVEPPCELPFILTLSGSP